MFDPHLRHWSLLPDGEPILTQTSHLLPVRFQGEPAMLKVAHAKEEKFGSLLMRWWDGKGAARVLAHDGDALLLERATGQRSLADIARTGSDDQACRILCRTVAHLHAPRSSPPPDAVPLAQWFQELAPAAAKHGGILPLCATTAEMLLAQPQDTVMLHGDIHHGNILDFGKRGWLAIDPKRLRGERGFDYANLFCNPDMETATAPGRLARRASVVAAASGMERRRLLQWVLAYSGLSAAWLLNEGDRAHLPLTIASQADAELQRLRREKE